MIKKIFSVALVAMSLAAIPAMAQNAEQNAQCKKTENCEVKKEKGKKHFDKDAKKMDKDVKLFEGMNLTEAQQLQLNQLQEKTRADRRAKKEAAREERKKKDEASKEERKLKKAEMERERREYLKEFRKIVGDDNYIIFLENSYVQKSDFKPNPHKEGAKGAGKDDKKSSRKADITGKFKKDKTPRDNAQS